MEKFSTWRDASNGIAPFVLPVPTGDDTAGPLLLAARLFQSIFAVIRFILFIVFVAIFLLLDSITSLLLQPWASIAYDTSTILGYVLLRPCLAVCFGYYYITEEQAATRRRATAARHAKPAAGDLVISNWSTFIDILYLQYKYSPVFVIPVVSATTSSTKYITTGLLGALALSGRIISQEAAPQTEPLDAIVKKAVRPLAILAEGTTSNNRAILKFATNGPLPALPEKAQVFLTVLKHDGPSRFRQTVTCPIPATVANPLPQIFSACTSPIIVPRHLLVRIVAPSEAPVLSSSTFWRQAADTMCAVGKLKQTNLGAEEKKAFLEYYFSKSRPKSRETVATPQRRKRT
ncbi:hypothetical protein P389DRAFT_3024 [Cystobasidium minutum MCA 4210]|uniref:uncharacterized protein n=1 Tax=Cystobasidium minutum MCA 4210 TaxID=1397322 RepID=UPI0034CDC2CD|eukprot:jgi/Rhomi1/3024/CE3023_2916